MRREGSEVGDGESEERPEAEEEAIICTRLNSPQAHGDACFPLLHVHHVQDGEKGRAGEGRRDDGDREMENKRM